MVTRHEEAAVPEEERARVWIRSCGLTRWRLRCWDVRSESELQTCSKHTDTQRSIQLPVRIGCLYRIASHHSAHAFSSSRRSVVAVRIGGNESLARQQLATSLMQDSHIGQFTIIPLLQNIRLLVIDSDSFLME
ncbi:hypothetical protein QQF64_033687 [Cirrhinus molitorella]|uniref:Uncharacterized protein n=1 Tax=Cirrhinus molitorella TaxID=172907 RepID=A0ABR3MUK9_9TELE